MGVEPAGAQVMQLAQQQGQGAGLHSGGADQLQAGALSSVGASQPAQG